jgi:hypothetical protein
MGALQTRAKSLVLPLVRGQQIDLSPLDQRVVAAWIAMCTITSEYFIPATAAIPWEDRDRVRHWTMPPSHWKIWIGNFKRDRWRPYRIHHALEITEEEAPDGPSVHHGRVARPNTQTTTLVFGQLYAHAVSSAVPEVVNRLKFPDAVSAILAQIWPQPSDTLHWPLGRIMTDRDADSAAAYLYVVRLTGSIPADG